MQKATLSVPSMYADHHVMRVRQLLLGLDGVESVTASAAKRVVIVQHEDGVVSTDVLGRVLAEAGYPVDTPVELEPMPQPSKDGSAWHTIIQRLTRTNQRDLEMSGDFRRY